MNLRLSFSWVGLVVFALPMAVNIAYAVFPPTDPPARPGAATLWVKRLEQCSRMAYLLALTLLVSQKPLRFSSIWLFLGAAFLILYHAVWLRYFVGGRRTALLGRAFLFIPMPLVVFPVLYYLFAAIWLQNLPAAIAMVIFGGAHLTVSIQSFR